MPTSRTRGRASEPRVAGGRNGYTLLEVVLVLAVFGLMATLVASGLDRAIPTQRLWQAAGSIASTVRWVHVESMSRAQSMAIRYDLEGGSYWVALADQAGSVPNTLEPPGERFHRQELPDGVGFADLRLTAGAVYEGGVVTVRFSSFGACEGHLVHLVAQEGRYSTVEVLPLAAQVNVHGSYVEGSSGAAH
jgi:prepilin-type N-terminal cleavage/methylation domain-containing protein